jgi:hypothetical protein
LDRVFGVFLQGLEQDGNVHLVGLHQVLFHILVPFLIDETSFEDFVIMGKYGYQEVSRGGRPFRCGNFCEIVALLGCCGLGV